jgi:hypothetical protein
MISAALFNHWVAGAFVLALTTGSLCLIWILLNLSMIFMKMGTIFVSLVLIATLLYAFGLRRPLTPLRLRSLLRLTGQRLRARYKQRNERKYVY